MVKRRHARYAGFMAIDWKRVAAERLEIRARDRRLLDLSSRAAEVVTRELLRHLHARCFSISDPRTQKMAEEIGTQVAEALTGAQATPASFDGYREAVRFLDQHIPGADAVRGRGEPVPGPERDPELATPVAGRRWSRSPRACESAWSVASAAPAPPACRDPPRVPAALALALHRLRPAGPRPRPRRRGPRRRRPRRRHGAPGRGARAAPPASPPAHRAAAPGIFPRRGTGCGSSSASAGSSGIPACSPGRGRGEGTRPFRSRSGTAGGSRGGAARAGGGRRASRSSRCRGAGALAQRTGELLVNLSLA